MSPHGGNITFEKMLLCIRDGWHGYIANLPPCFTRVPSINSGKFETLVASIFQTMMHFHCDLEVHVVPSALNNGVIIEDFSTSCDAIITNWFS